MKAGSYATRLFYALLSSELRKIPHWHSSRSSFSARTVLPFPHLHSCATASCAPAPSTFLRLFKKQCGVPPVLPWLSLRRIAVGRQKIFAAAAYPKNSHHRDICIFFSVRAAAFRHWRTSRQLIDAYTCDLWHESCCKRSAGFQANIAFSEATNQKGNSACRLRLPAQVGSADTSLAFGNSFPAPCGMNGGSPHGCGRA